MPDVYDVLNAKEFFTITCENLVLNQHNIVELT